MSDGRRGERKRPGHGRKEKSSSASWPEIGVPTNTKRRWQCVRCTGGGSPSLQSLLDLSRSLSPLCRSCCHCILGPRRVDMGFG